MEASRCWRPPFKCFQQSSEGTACVSLARVATVRQRHGVRGNKEEATKSVRCSTKPIPASPASSRVVMKKQSKRNWRVRNLRQTAATTGSLRHGTMEAWPCLFQKREQPQGPDPHLGDVSPRQRGGCTHHHQAISSPRRTARKAHAAASAAHVDRICRAAEPMQAPLRLVGRALGEHGLGGDAGSLANREQHELLCCTTDGRLAAAASRGAAVTLCCLRRPFSSRA